MQDDATVKCWGDNGHGRLGQGDTSGRGDEANGPCPPSSTTACLVPASCVLTQYSCSVRAEMGANLPAVDLGDGRTAVAVSAGYTHTCAILVRFRCGSSGGGNLQNMAIEPNNQINHLAAEPQPPPPMDCLKAGDP